MQRRRPDDKHEQLNQNNSMKDQFYNVSEDIIFWSINTTIPLVLQLTSSPLIQTPKNIARNIIYNMSTWIKIQTCDENMKALVIKLGKKISLLHTQKQDDKKINWNTKNWWIAQRILNLFLQSVLHSIWGWENKPKIVH